MTPQITPNRYSIGTLTFASITIPWKSRNIYTVNFHPFFRGLVIPLHWIHYPSLGGLSLTSNRQDQDANARRFITSSSPSATADTEERKGRTKSFRGPKSSKVRGNKAKKSCLYFWAKQRFLKKHPVCPECCAIFLAKSWEGWGLIPDKNFQVENCGKYFSLNFGSFGPRPVIWGICSFPLKSIKPSPPDPAKAYLFCFKGSMAGLAKCCENFGSSYKAPQKNRRLFLFKKLTANQ